MKNYPVAWFRNIVAILEGRSYHTYNVLLFSLFVAAFRLFSEWALGGEHLLDVMPMLVMVTAFYWLAFFSVTAVLAVLVDQPWRRCINVILVGIFLGILPPLIDRALEPGRFVYGYVYEFPEQWRWLIYNPAHRIIVGEATVLWALIVLTSSYVYHKTGSLWRASAAMALSYGVVVLLMALVATGANLITARLNWPSDHQITMLNLMQFVSAWAIYLLLQRRVRALLLRNWPHFGYFLFLYALGAGLVDAPSATTVAYAGVLATVISGWIVSRAFWLGGSSDAASADADDNRFFALTVLFLTISLAVANSLTGLPLCLLLLSMGRGYATSRLGEGIAGLSAFALGLVAAFEHAVYEMPRWWISSIPGDVTVHSLERIGTTPVLLTGVVVFLGSMGLGLRFARP